MYTLIHAHRSNKDTKSHHIVYGTPTSGSFGDYLLLKQYYRKRDKDHDWRYKVAFNIKFLRKQKRIYGDLVCAYCGKPHLQIEYPSGRLVSQKIKATVDHFVAKSQDGEEFNTDNFVVACGKCNSKKGSNMVDIELLKFAPKERLEKIEKYLQNYLDNWKKSVIFVEENGVAVV